MKLLLLIFLPCFSFCQQSTYQPGDSVWLTSSDSVHFDVAKVKMDTIGPIWKQVSDTTTGYNPVMAMKLYEVRVYSNEWITKDATLFPDASMGLTPHHFAWLDTKKKPFKLKVW